MDIKKLASTDQNEPIRIDENIWWVGHYLKGDPFQCHCYLIENGRDSILIDPGSRLTFPHVFAKVEKIIPFSHIKYIVVHHQDPDIISSLDIIDKITSGNDLCLLSHWRAMALLKHLDLNIPMKCVESMNWQLTAGEREIEFVFTPYLHFPGAFCTYDKKTGSLFSSDLFGGFTEEFSLFAEDKSYLEPMLLFHQHYMPSKEILSFAMEKFEQLPLRTILPQHGSIIRKEWIPFYIGHLKNLDCGLYLLTQTSTEIQRLSLLNRFVDHVMQTLVFNRFFDNAAEELLHHIRKIIPRTKDLRFIMTPEERPWILLEKKSRFQGTPWTPSEETKKKLSSTSVPFSIVEIEKKPTVLLPLKQSGGNKIFAYACITLAESVEIDLETRSIFEHITAPLSIVLEREMIRLQLDSEKQQFYELSIKDSLTGLYNRTYMNETIPRLLSHHDREFFSGLALLMLDLDHFKTVNDTYGHSIGDQVLKKVAEVIMANLREGDIPVRIGGEEFAVFLPLNAPQAIPEIAERIRRAIQEIDFSDLMTPGKQTISGGMVIRRKNESLEKLLIRADTYLYQAKREGRNIIVVFKE